MDQIALNIQAQADTASIRNDTFDGRDYIVVPVVALVEGVLHSANAENPELALATEFGKFPNAWDGRPLVMNHPKVDDNYVSANSPAVLSDWAFGQIFNTYLDDNKLKTEAWIDIERVNTLGGEAATTLERIQNGDMVEISTGLFAAVEALQGDYSGTAYEGVWRSVTPDHLAFLSEGTIGACSVEDGCGVPRLNTLRRVPVNNHDCGCGCEGEGNCGDRNMERSETDQLAKANSALDHLISNSMPSDMPIENARTLLSDALDASLRAENDGLYHIYTFTPDIVVYETWNSNEKFQRSFTITDNVATLADDVVEVNMMTSIVPKANSSEASAEDEEPNVNENEVEVETESSAEGNDDMSDATQEATPSNPTPETETQVEASAETVTEEAPAVNTTPATVDDYIAAAPAGMQEVLANSLKMHNDKKASLVAGLVANDRCKFSQEQLDGMDLGMLENLTTLSAAPAADYSGAGGTPIANATASAADDQNSVPKMQEAFPVKTDATAA